MTTFDQIFLGIMLVGLGLLIKVFQEGVFQLNQLKYKKELFLQASEQFRSSIVYEQTQLEKRQSEINAQKQELGIYQDKQQRLEKKIEVLETKLGRSKRTRFKVEL